MIQVVSQDYRDKFMGLGAVAPVTYADVESVLKLRGFQSSAVGQTSTTPVYTKQQCIDWGLDGALAYYIGTVGSAMVKDANGHYVVAGGKVVTFGSANWDWIINYTLNYANQCVTVTSIAGLSGLGEGYMYRNQRLGALGAMEYVYNPITKTFQWVDTATNVPVAEDTSVWSWGGWPILLQIFGSSLTILGNYVQTQQLKDQVQAAVGSQATMSTTDESKIAAYLKAQGATDAQISSVLTSLSATTPAAKSGTPSWVLPVGIAAVGLVLLMQRRG